MPRGNVIYSLLRIIYNEPFLRALCHTSFMNEENIVNVYSKRQDKVPGSGGPIPTQIEI